MLRKYQEKIVVDIISSNDNAIVALPTGGGKSHIIQQVVLRSRHLKFAIVVRNAPLISQLISRLKEVGLTVGVIKAKYEFDANATYDVYLIMEQTFYSRADKVAKHIDKIDVVLKDEFHTGYDGNQFNFLIDKLKPGRVVGLTATPLTPTGVGIHTILDNYRLIDDISTHDLIDMEFLSKVRYSLPSNSRLTELKNVKITNGDYASGELDAVINTKEHNEFIVDEVMSKCITPEPSRKTLIFANSIAHVEALHNSFSSRGIETVHLHSGMSDSDKAENMELYMSGSINIMINMSMLTTGFDDPATNAIVLVRPTKILRLYLQIVGRGLRILEGKKDCLVLDLAECLKEHGFAESKRSFNIANKEEVAEEKDKNQLDELPDVISNNEVSSARVIEYRLSEKQNRIDELLEKIQLLEMENAHNQSNDDTVNAHIKKVQIARATVLHTSIKYNTEISNIKEQRDKSRLELIKYKRNYEEIPADVLLDMDNHLAKMPNIVDFQYSTDEDRDAELVKLKSIIGSNDSSFSKKLMSANSAYKILNRSYLSDATIETILDRMRNSRVFYMEKSMTTMLRNRIAGRKSINLLNSISWVEDEWEKKQNQRNTSVSSWS